MGKGGHASVSIASRRYTPPLEERRDRLGKSLEYARPLHHDNLYAVQPHASIDSLIIGQRDSAYLEGLDIIEHASDGHDDLIDAVTYFGNIAYIGRAGDGITAGICGGKIINHDYVSFDGEKKQLRPDVVNLRDSWDGHPWVYEDKMVASTDGRCKIDAKQLNLLIRLQLKMPDFRFGYHIMVYDPPKDLAAIESAEDVYTGVAKGMRYSVMLPLSAILGLHDTDDYKLINREGASKGRREAIRTSSYTTHGLLSDPLAIIKRLKLDTMEYDVERFLSPRRFYLNGQHVKPFPMVWMTDRHHDEQVGRLRERYGDEQIVRAIPNKPLGEIRDFSDTELFRSLYADCIDDADERAAIQAGESEGDDSFDIEAFSRPAA